MAIAGLHARHSDGRYYGMSELQVNSLYQSATLLVNLHGGTHPLPEHVATGRLVYLGTDPVNREIELHQQQQDTIELLEQHNMLFTWAENYGQPDCGIPVSERFRFIPTRQPVVIDLWEATPPKPSNAFTTVAGWQQLWRDVVLNGEVYRWSKSFEFMKFVDLPSRTSQALELALAGCNDTDRRVLEEHGWRIRDAAEVSDDVDTYRAYIAQLAGGVHRREGPERTSSQRLVQRSKRHVSRRATTRGHAGHGVRQRVPDRAGTLRVFDDG